MVCFWCKIRLFNPGVPLPVFNKELQRFILLISSGSHGWGLVFMQNHEIKQIPQHQTHKMVSCLWIVCCDENMTTAGQTVCDSVDGSLWSSSWDTFPNWLEGCLVSVGFRTFSSSLVHLDLSFSFYFSDMSTGGSTRGQHEKHWMNEEHFGPASFLRQSVRKLWKLFYQRWSLWNYVHAKWDSHIRGGSLMS